MALVEKGWAVLVDLTDRGGNTTTRTYPLVGTDDAGDITVLVATAAEILTRLDTVTLAAISGWSLAKRFIENDLTLPTDGAAEVEAHALITWPIYQHPEKSGTIDIPAPAAAVFQGTTGKPYNQVDFTNTDVLEYVGIFTFAGGLATISDGEQLSDNLGGGGGKRTHSRSNKG